MNLECLECCYCFTDILEEENNGDALAGKEQIQAVSCNEGHLACYSCFEMAVKTAVGDQKVVCCGDGSQGKPCGAGYSFRFVELAIHDAKLQKAYDMLVANTSLREANMDNLYSCPFCDNAAIIEIPVEEQPHFSCDGCHKQSCRTCRKEWHEGPCNPEDHSKEEEETRNYVLTCCGQSFVRSDGCNKVQCPRCRGMWCWVCKKSISRTNPYGHFKPGGCILHGDPVGQNIQPGQKPIRKPNPRPARGRGIPVQPQRGNNQRVNGQPGNLQPPIRRLVEQQIHQFGMAARPPHIQANAAPINHGPIALRHKRPRLEQPLPIQNNPVQNAGLRRTNRARIVTPANPVPVVPPQLAQPLPIPAEPRRKNRARIVTPANPILVGPHLNIPTTYQPPYRQSLPQGILTFTAENMHRNEQIQKDKVEVIDLETLPTHHYPNPVILDPGPGPATYRKRRQVNQTNQRLSIEHQDEVLSLPGPSNGQGVSDGPLIPAEPIKNVNHDVLLIENLEPAPPRRVPQHPLVKPIDIIDLVSQKQDPSTIQCKGRNRHGSRCNNNAQNGRYCQIHTVQDVIILD